MNILITGSCGVTSRAIARSLRISDRYRAARIVGTDICQNRYGLYEQGLFDVSYPVAHVTAAGYEEMMLQICKEESIDAAVVIPELEVRFWSKRTFPVPAMLPPPKFSELVVSKKRLYEALAETELVPKFAIVDRDEILDGHSLDAFPVWVRSFDEGSTSGKGACLVHNQDELAAWMTLNPEDKRLMVAEVLPGRNFACHLLYQSGELVKVATYERLKYFMGHIAVSGISGNICEGRLVNEPKAVDASVSAVERIIAQTNETMHGIVAVDLREADDGKPMITEINLRHVAATYSFAAAGHNLSEAQVSLTLDSNLDIGDRDMEFPPHNMILRDIDGPPLWVAEFTEPVVGQPFQHNVVSHS